MLINSEFNWRSAVCGVILKRRNKISYFNFMVRLMLGLVALMWYWVNVMDLSSLHFVSSA